MISMRAISAALLTLAACSRAVTTGAPTGGDAVDAITESDLRRDLFVLAGDAMRGREATTGDELRASAWLAERARAAGLEPAGDDGTYFQFFPVRRTRVAAGSTIALNGAALAMTGARPDEMQTVVVTPVDARIDAPIVYLGEGRDADVANVDVRGKVVAAVLTPPRNFPPLGRDPTPRRRYATLAVRERVAFLTARGAAAVIVVSDSIADLEFDNIAAGWARGSYALDTTGARAGARAGVPTIWVRRAMLDRVRAPGARLATSLATESFVVSSVNVIGRVRGTDARLRDEHVLFSAHQDGLGVRYVWEGDSIWNGADDNATTSVSVLAIGRAFARMPARRSALFVWHGSEEVGLLGSRWHVMRPVVPRASIVAVLNGDMIGRNHPDTAALLGSQPPNRNSPDLVAMALAANARVSRFAIDSSWDRPSHPESFFTRSDHYPYAREGVPVVYFTSMLHPDYHTPRDEPERIDVAKLARMTRWMYATGWAVANAATRPALDPGFRLER